MSEPKKAFLSTKEDEIEGTYQLHQATTGRYEYEAVFGCVNIFETGFFTEGEAISHFECLFGRIPKDQS